MNKPIKIPLNPTGFALVDAEWAHLTNKKTWRLSTGGYARWHTRRNKKHASFSMHRIIINAPDGAIVDHINGDKLDNRKTNLRLCNQMENSRNQPKRTGKTYSSKYKGVCFNKTHRRWMARVQKNGQNKTIGWFKNEIDAAKAYDRVSKEIYGAFARPNFPEEST